MNKVSKYAPSWFSPTVDDTIVPVLKSLEQSTRASRSASRRWAATNKTPELVVEADDSISVRGYHKFSFRSDGKLIIEEKAEKFLKLRNVLRSLHQTYNVSTFLDVGCHAGLASFVAKANGYTDRIIGLDRDAECVDVYNHVVERRQMTGIRAHVYSFGDTLPLHYRSEVVFLGAVIHWFFSRTAQFEDFESIFEFLYYVVGRFLLIEWVDPLDDSLIRLLDPFSNLCGKELLFAKCIKYSQSRFEHELNAHFFVHDRIPVNEVGTRVLYVAEIAS